MDELGISTPNPRNKFGKREGFGGLAPSRGQNTSFGFRRFQDVFPSSETTQLGRLEVVPRVEAMSDGTTKTHLISKLLVLKRQCVACGFESQNHVVLLMSTCE
jgi:hypothetical protein